MPELTPREQRHERIQIMQAIADSLLADQLDEPMKANVRLALDELNDALEYLSEPAFDTRPRRQLIADMAISNAESLLRGVARANKLAGRDASVFETD